MRVAAKESPGASPAAPHPDKEADEPPAPAGKWGVAADDTRADAEMAVTSSTDADEENEKASRSLTRDLVRALGETLSHVEGPRLASVAKETWIHGEPRRRSRRIGYLRAGAIVRRAEEPASFDGCKSGWYAIEPRGFVCAERTATLDLDAPVLQVAHTAPRMHGLPYDYAIARLPGPIFYAHVPTAAEQAHEEPDLGFRHA